MSSQPWWVDPESTMEFADDAQHGRSGNNRRKKENDEDAAVLKPRDSKKRNSSGGKRQQHGLLAWDDGILTQ